MESGNIIHAINHKGFPARGRGTDSDRTRERDEGTTKMKTQAGSAGVSCEMCNRSSGKSRKLAEVADARMSSCCAVLEGAAGAGAGAGPRGMARQCYLGKCELDISTYMCVSVSVCACV